MNDEQLLEKYKKYIKRRNLIVVFSLLFIVSIIAVLLIMNSRKNIEIPSKNEIPSVEEPKPDINPPVLELTTNNTKIIIGENFDYKSFIKSAYDDIDGDLTEKVSYSKIDLTKEGTFEIVYYVFDSSNNIAQQILTLVVETKPEEQEKPSEKEPETPKSTQKPSKNNNTSSNNNEKPIKQPTVKYFLFTDGYNMNNVVESCAKELKSSSRTGRCIPITDDNGIYLGMKLELN